MGKHSMFDRYCFRLCRVSVNNALHLFDVSNSSVISSVKYLGSGFINLSLQINSVMVFYAFLISI